MYSSDGLPPLVSGLWVSTAYLRIVAQCLAVLVGMHGTVSSNGIYPSTLSFVDGYACADHLG